MPISSAGNNTHRTQGITLIELMVVVAIIALLVGETLPAATNGLSSIHLRGAASDVAAFLNSALNRAERHEQTVEIIVYPKQSRLELDSSEPGYTRTLQLREGIQIAGDNPIRVLLLPGSAPPRIALDLFNDRGTHRIVRLDPVTGVPQIQAVTP
jgi:prepilin-type N-terminal cleavage/methylation domain-containing protein